MRLLTISINLNLNDYTGQVVVSAISSNDVSDDEAMLAMMAMLQDVEIEAHMFRHKTISGINPRSKYELSAEIFYNSCYEDFISRKKRFI